ncbi:MAG: 2-phosphosulfolactate phosphatase [Candidatus Stygibacter frigidus]|nr:2-phosphosulfolactate phosphatase [Candidatus Stygibacter frigidus]
MKIKYLHLMEGACQAEGIAIVIDVFRAFSLEAYLFAAGVSDIIAVESLPKARQLKAENSGFLIFGEREGIIQPGFDYGNSPFHSQSLDLKGKTAVHASSSGTRGLVAAMNSSAIEVLTGSFVNAQAIASYIKNKNPETVSLIDMGWAGQRPTQEDTICADYLHHLITGSKFNYPDYIYKIFSTDGQRFFDPENQSSMPREDFFLCLRPNIFPFILKANYTANGNIHLHKIIPTKQEF